MSLFQKNRLAGMSPFIVVIVISAVALLMASTATLTGIEEVKLSQHHRQSKVHLMVADGCMEAALSSLNQNHAYSGGPLTLNGILCAITVSGSGSTRTLRITVDAGGTYPRTLETDVDWTSAFQVLGWREVIN